MWLRSLLLHCLVFLLPFAIAFYRTEQPSPLDNQDRLLTKHIGKPLADVQVEKAIASLIDQLPWDDDYSLTHRRWTTAMIVLVEVGPAAIPQLIDAILEAPVKAAAAKCSDGSQPSEFMIRYFTANLQTRAAMVLGLIGDSRALPVLTNLECQPHSVECYYIQEAIRSILERVSRSR